MILALLAATVLMADSTTAMQAAPAVSAPAAQAAAAATPDNAKPKKQATNNGLICRNEPTLGTRLPTKKCRSTEQMAAQRQEDQANLEKMQRMDQPGH